MNINFIINITSKKLLDKFLSIFQLSLNYFTIFYLKVSNLSILLFFAQFLFTK